MAANCKRQAIPADPGPDYKTPEINVTPESLKHRQYINGHNLSISGFSRKMIDSVFHVEKICLIARPDPIFYAG